MGIHRARRVQGPRVMPKIARTISKKVFIKSKEVFMNAKRTKRGKQKMSFQDHEISQKNLDNQNSLVLKISDLAKRMFF